LQANQKIQRRKKNVETKNPTEWNQNQELIFVFVKWINKSDLTDVRKIIERKKERKKEKKKDKSLPTISVLFLL
jgi:hypothetical protein